MTVYYACPHCEAEIEVDVVINEEDDLPEERPECGGALPERAHEDVHVMAVERAADSYEDWL